VKVLGPDIERARSLIAPILDVPNMEGEVPAGADAARRVPAGAGHVSRVAVKAGVPAVVSGFIRSRRREIATAISRAP
jgi:hypothetical protein